MQLQIKLHIEELCNYQHSDNGDIYLSDPFLLPSSSYCLLHRLLGLNLTPISTISFSSFSSFIVLYFLRFKICIDIDHEESRQHLMEQKNASQLSRDGKIFVEAFLKAYNLHLN